MPEPVAQRGLQQEPKAPGYSHKDPEPLNPASPKPRGSNRKLQTLAELQPGTVVQCLGILPLISSDICSMLFVVVLVSLGEAVVIRGYSIRAH